MFILFVDIDNKSPRYFLSVLSLLLITYGTKMLSEALKGNKNNVSCIFCGKKFKLGGLHEPGRVLSRHFCAHLFIYYCLCGKSHTTLRDLQQHSCILKTKMFFIVDIASYNNFVLFINRKYSELLMDITFPKNFALVYLYPIEGYFSENIVLDFELGSKWLAIAKKPAAEDRKLLIKNQCKKMRALISSDSDLSETEESNNDLISVASSQCSPKTSVLESNTITVKPQTQVDLKESQKIDDKKIDLTSLKLILNIKDGLKKKGFNDCVKLKLASIRQKMQKNSDFSQEEILVLTALLGEF